MEEHTHDGVFYRDNNDWRFLRHNNYYLVGDFPSKKDLEGRETSDGFFTFNGTYYDGSWKKWIWCQDSWGLDYYQLEHEEKGLEPGIYRLTGIGRVDSDGAFLYAMVDEEKMLREIPVYKRNDEVYDEEEFDEETVFDEDESKENVKEKDKTSVETPSKQVAHPDSVGDGWARVVIDNIEVNNGKLKYGVSAVPSFTGSKQKCTELEIGELLLEKVK